MSPPVDDSLQSARERLQDALAYRFVNHDLLSNAMTHRSYGQPNNERLEFLGDAVLDAVVAELLYVAESDAPEGLLSRQRAALVNGQQLASLARELGLDKALLLGQGERTSKVRDSILEGAFEALVGALFLDADYERCRVVLSTLLAPLLKASAEFVELKDNKTLLQEFTQAAQQRLPVYSLLEARGPDHAKEFLVSVKIAEPAMQAEGLGSSRKAAEQQAAGELLAQLEQGSAQ